MADPIDYDTLKKAAAEARFERWLSGRDNPQKRRMRPRTAEEIAALHQAHLDRLDRWPPRYEDGVLILPYYFGD